MNRRLPALVLVAAVTVAAVALDRSASDTVTPAVASRPVDGPVIPPEDAASVAWYCAEGTSTLDGRADETIIIGNLAPEPIDASVTVVRGDLPSASREVRVEAYGQERIPVSDVLATTEPGVIVEVFGGPAIVEHELRGREDVAVGPCAREPSKEWFFAAGNTLSGAEEWLALFNPFGDDAIVDITFLTDTGVQQPEAARGVVVPRHSRVSLAIHELVQRQERVAIGVRAMTGRVVAERSQRFDASQGIIGLAASLGVTGAAAEWHVSFGDSAAGVTRTLSLANFGGTTAAVEIATPLDGRTTVEPRTIDVAPRSVVSVDTSEVVPVDTGYSVSVRVARGSPVVAEVYGTWVAPSEVGGVALAPAAAAGARRWAFAVGRLDRLGQAFLSAVNLSGRPITVQMYAYTEGDPDSPASAPAEAVPPGERAVFGLRERDVTADQVIVITADGPIVAGRDIEGNGASLSVGVPDRS